MKKILKLITPEQYIKNIFLYFPLFFTFQLFDFQKFISVTAGFICFSIIANSIYILNDIKDIENDRMHPYKKSRPIASGEVPIKTASIFGLIMLSIGFIISFSIDKRFLIILLIYVILNILYSIKLKQIVLIDIILISIGFVLRVVSGAIIINVEPSTWIILLTFMLAMFIAITKRREDLLLSDKIHDTRKDVKGYNLEFLNAAMVIMASITIVSYIMYTTTPEVSNRLKSNKLFITVIFVILGILRYMQLSIVYKRTGSPARLILNDLFLKSIIALWFLSYLIILYRDMILKVFVF